MLIGELVEKIGFSKDTIRFYEKKGLISLGPADRRENNYKEYSAQVEGDLITIRKLKDMGFTLKEIATFLELWRADGITCNGLKYTIEDKIAFVSEQLLKLTELKKKLTDSLNRCNHDACEFEKPISRALKKIE